MDPDATPRERAEEVDASQDLWRGLPKVELHVHLDCSLSLAALRQLDATITEEVFFTEYALSDSCQGLADFLTRIPRSLAWLQNEKGLRVAVDGLFQEFQADHVIYAEVRFAPLLHTTAGMSPETVVGIVTDAMAAARARTGIHGGLILCTLRHFDRKQGETTVALCRDFMRHGVVGLDLAADEAAYPLTPHVSAFQLARSYGVNTTAHAGEALGPHSVWETLRALDPQRIGHGVRSVEDANLIKELVQRGIHLEVCPGCNVQLGLFSCLAQHPIHALRQEGVSVGVNTDGRTLPRNSLSQEYAGLARVWGWDQSDFLHGNLCAMKAAFASDEIKDELIAVLRAACA